MARAMSGSLASARMKSLAPRGSAWMRASLTSSDFCTMTCPPLAPAPLPPRPPGLPRRARDDPAVRRPGRLADRGRTGAGRLRLTHLADPGLDLVDGLAQHPGR